MMEHRLRWFSVWWTVLLVVIVFVCPSCRARPRQQLRTRSAAHSYAENQQHHHHHPSIPFLRRIAKKVDPTPVPSSSPSARPSMATVPLTASSFSVITPSPSPSTVRVINPTIVPSANPPLPAAASIVEETADVVPRSKNGRRRKNRLVAILVPILTVSFLLLAFLLLLFLRRRRRGAVNETYAELGSNESSSSSPSSLGTPRGENAAPPPEEPDVVVPTNEAAQFVFPFPVPSRKARQRKDSDSIVMQVERIEIAGVGNVVVDGVHFLCTTTGALQLAVAYEASKVANNETDAFKDGGEEETTSSGGWSDLTGESYSVAVSNKQRKRSRNETGSMVRITGIQGTVNPTARDDTVNIMEDPDPQCKHITMTRSNAPRIRNDEVDPNRTVSVDSSSTTSPINGEKEWLEWKYRGENFSDSQELKLSETTETETSSSICS